MKRLFVVLITTSIFTSCLFLWEAPIDPEKKATMDAYATVSNYHTVKQMVLIEHYALFSNNFQNEMYELIPNGNQLRDFWDILEVLYEIEADLESAFSTIDEMDEVSTANDLLLLKSVQAAKWDWLWKKVYWVGDRIEMREKLTSFFNNASQAEKEEAFQTFENGGRVNGISDVNEFVSKLNKGELDTRAFNFDKDLEVYHSTYSKWKEDNGVPRNIESAIKISKKGIEHGTKIMTKSVEYALPPVGTAIDALDKVNKFCEYANNFLSDENALQKVESNLSENYKMYVSDATSHSKSIEEQAKVISKTYTINKEPASTVVDYSNADWGGLTVSIEDKAAEISTVIAERSSELVDDIWPAIMVYTDMVKNELGEWDMALPEGDWDITSIDDKGNVHSDTETPILAGHFKMLNYTSDLNDKDEDPGNDDSGIIDDEVMDLLALLKSSKVIEIYVDPNDGEDPFKLRNDLFYSKKTEITWSNNTFESNESFSKDATNRIDQSTYLADSRNQTINGKIYKKDNTIVLDINYSYNSKGYSVKGSSPHNVFMQLLGIQEFSAKEVTLLGGKNFGQSSTQRENAADFASFHYQWTHLDSDSIVTYESIRNEFKASSHTHYNVTFKD